MVTPACPLMSPTTLDLSKAAADAINRTEIAKKCGRAIIIFVPG